VDSGKRVKRNEQRVEESAAVAFTRSSFLSTRSCLACLACLAAVRSEERGQRSEKREGGQEAVASTRSSFLSTRSCLAWLAAVRSEERGQRREKREGGQEAVASTLSSFLSTRSCLAAALVRGERKGRPLLHQPFLSSHSSYLFPRLNVPCARRPARTPPMGRPGWRYRRVDPGHFRRSCAGCGA
jgi:hypothetical protein